MIQFKFTETGPSTAQKYSVSGKKVTRNSVSSFKTTLTAKANVPREIRAWPT